VECNFVLNPSTPKKINYKVKEFCRSIRPDASPVFIAVIGGYPANKCHWNVRAHVAAQGGRQVMGWIIWQGKWSIQAEYHSVWESPSPLGELLDITDKEHGEKQIVFLADDQHKGLIDRAEDGDAFNILPANILSRHHERAAWDYQD
jgi:hypothetical protein